MPEAATHRTPAHVVDAYFTAVTAGDAAAVTALFAADAVIVNSLGQVEGAAAIQAMYENGLTTSASPMRPVPGPLHIDGSTVAVEIELFTGTGSVHLADFFTVMDGEIRRLAIYSLTPAAGRVLDDLSSSGAVDPTPTDTPSNQEETT